VQHGHKLTRTEEEEKEKNSGLLPNKPKGKVYHGYKIRTLKKKEKKRTLAYLTININ
jgi:hypothetical protein